MLKETGSEKTIGFFVTFLPLVACQLGGGRRASPGYAYAIAEWRDRPTIIAARFCT